MAKISLAGFKDPVRRPRYLIWTGVVVLCLAAFIIAAVGGTSTYWFCASLCHSVQDDAINTYDISSHNMVSCISCHEPPNANPAVFLYYKAKAGIVGAYELYTKTNSTPLNAESSLALNTSHMGSIQCTQCHNMETRVVTPSKGIIIDHAVHEDRHIQCTGCHNRVAHNEQNYEMVNSNPKTGEISAKHADFMSMTACFRCHTLTAESPSGADYKAPGRCSACHSADFDLKPVNHKAAGFYPAGHAELAMAPIDRSTGRPVPGGEAAEAEDAHAEEGAEEHSGSSHALELASVEAVDYCATCHIVDTFCMDCHGMEMPHPTEFTTKTHPALAESKADKCDLCHSTTETDFLFCNDCHHGSKVGWDYDPTIVWQTQHAKTVVDKGVAICLGACHAQVFCVDCHTTLKPIPTSHEAKDWLHNKLTVTVYGKTPAAPTASHAVNALKAVDGCEVCHGTGGINAAFCKSCHGMDMPHPEQFKKTHVTGAKTPALCANCHQFAELCSDCHHVGAVNGVPWQTQHPKTITDKGANPCFEKCHEDKQFCVDCHTTLKAVPTSHTTATWTRDLALGKAAGHPTAYKAATDSCDYCHGTGGVKAKFCADCHKLEMPHPGDFGTTHGPDITAKKTTKAVCENCHSQFFCDNCHHTGAVASQPWRNYHPNIVKKDGLDPCLACHDFVKYCEYCHVSILN